jgi:hypothetical protein
VLDLHPLDGGELFFRHAFEQTLGDQRHTVVAFPQRLAFENRTL